MNTPINLLRSLIHPQGVGRSVPGCYAATLPLALSRARSFLVYLARYASSLAARLLALKLARYDC